jgi:hypothetical protein
MHHEISTVIINPCARGYLILKAMGFPTHPWKDKVLSHFVFCLRIQAATRGCTFAAKSDQCPIAN